MAFADRVWTLERLAAAPDFSQRFRGELSADGATIRGRWDTSHDRGATWAADFELTYTRVPTS